MAKKSGGVFHPVTPHEEARTFRLIIIGYWLLFWFFNVVDKVIGGQVFLWAGKDRMAQFKEYFASIGVTHPFAATSALTVASLLEALAVLLFAAAFIAYLRKNVASERRYTFYGIIISLLLFTLFAIGDQAFGDRFELLEHSLYWLALLVSWYLYTLFAQARHGRKTR